MTEVSFVADVHVGNHLRYAGPVVCSINSRCRLVLGVLNLAAKAAYEKGPLIVAGDLTDSDMPEAPILAALQETFARAQLSEATSFGENRPRTYLLSGNHDSHSDEVGDSALAPLAAEGLVAVVYEPTIQRFGSPKDGIIDVVMMPYRSGSTRKWLPEEVDRVMSNYKPPKGSAGVRVLCMHAGLVTVSTPPYLKDSHDALEVSQVETIMERHGFEYCLSGNWHHRVRFDKPAGTILQIGALVPTGFDNPGLSGYGSLITISNTASDTHHLFLQELPGPRFVKVKSKTELENTVHMATDRGHKLIIEYEVHSSEVAAAEAFLQELKNNQSVWAGEVVSAAPLTKKTGDVEDDEDEIAIDDFISQWIDKMPLPAVVNRQDVKSIVTKCLMRSK